MTLQCDLISYWLGAYTKWSLHATGATVVLGLLNFGQNYQIPEKKDSSWNAPWKKQERVAAAPIGTYIAHNIPDSKVHGANMGPIWGRQDPGGPHVRPMNFAIWAGPISKTRCAIYTQLKQDKFMIYCWLSCNASQSASNVSRFTKTRFTKKNKKMKLRQTVPTKALQKQISWKCGYTEMKI